jgi:phosphoribosylformimino-5-aminoimidazole carboxamide ribotide isomerase
MILFPAIDLKEGRCVRLVRGDMNQATVFNDDPAAQAKIFFEQGFTHLHVVDLDGAFAGKPMNASAVEGILAAVPDMKIQLGGGIRDVQTVEACLSKGLARVIIGTAAVREPEFVKQAAKAFPNQVIVGIDAKEGMVAVEGWAQTSQLRVEEMADRFADAGVAAIIYTDIARDGVLLGVNWEATRMLADHSSIPIIGSGGLASLSDIETMIALNHPRIEGVISGRALYDGRIDPAKALELLSKTSLETHKKASSC